MDLEQLVTNIRNAQEESKRDIEHLKQQRVRAEQAASLPDLTAATLRLAAAEAVEATLGRLLGETRSLSW